MMDWALNLHRLFLLVVESDWSGADLLLLLCGGAIAILGGVSLWLVYQLQQHKQVSKQLLEQTQNKLKRQNEDLELHVEQRTAALQHLTEQQQALAEVIGKIRAPLGLDAIFHLAATEVRQLLNVDRVGIFRFYPDSGFDDGEFVSEAVLPPYASALKRRIHDHCFGERYAVHYQQGQIQAVADVLNAGLADCHIAVLSQFQIRANLIVPLLRGKVLWGLLCIHQCSEPRQWQTSEIEFVRQIAVQLDVALYQAELLQETQAKTQELEATLHQLQAMQLQLVQSEKMSSLGQLVAGVAHEINNPVNFIYGNLAHVDHYTQDLLDLLQLYKEIYVVLPADVQAKIDLIDLDFILADLPKLLASMKVGTDRIREIVLSLRNFSRLDQFEMKHVWLHEGIDSTLMILQHRLKPSPQQPGIEVIKDYGELPLVECSAGQLNQVFMNLLSNAIDALQDAHANDDKDVNRDRPGVITIQTQRLDTEHVQIVVRDNGPGMSSATQQKLFDPFFTTKVVGKGTGLGLSISYQIIERHGGTLRCVSTPDQGSAFYIEMPIVQAKKASDAKVTVLASE
ncbi:MAG: GAF domain-containing protein [Stenomitos rutilans HA7619-LM2]|jgi:signal transduction histidine kinase|nr:GAF domain-containing protein [Stenomitos rutilans HA7619-LM2]